MTNAGCLILKLNCLKSVKRIERSNGLDTALYKNYFFYHYPFVCRLIIITLNDSAYYACLSCVGFKICELDTNDLIQ